MVVYLATEGKVAAPELFIPMRNPTPHKHGPRTCRANPGSGVTSAGCRSMRIGMTD
jgi:hypothetical protein